MIEIPEGMQVEVTMPAGQKLNLLLHTIASVERMGEGFLKVTLKGPEIVIMENAEVAKLAPGGEWSGNAEVVDGGEPPAGSLPTSDNPPPPSSEPPAAT